MICRLYDWHGKDPVLRYESEMGVDYIREHENSFGFLLDDVADGLAMAEFEIAGRWYEIGVTADDDIRVWWLVPDAILPEEKVVGTVAELCDWFDELERVA